METGVISVIVPVFDVAGQIDDCLRSVASQTFENLEIILIDDGSTDGSGAICDQWAQRDARVRVFHQGNRGLSAARNMGLDHATGEFVLFVDPDDTVSSVYAETLYKAIVDLQVPCVMCGYSVRGLDGFTSVSKPTFKPAVISERECFTRVMKLAYRSIGNLSYAVWCKMYHRSLFEDSRIRFPEGEVYEDISVMARIMHACEWVGLIPDVLYYKRMRVSSISQSYTADSLCDWEKAVNRFTNDVTAVYPDLADEADRYLEKRHINAWLEWHKLWMDSRDFEMRERVFRARDNAMAHVNDLSLPDDLRQLLTLQLLRLAPGLAPTIQRAWVRLRLTVFSKNDGFDGVAAGVKKAIVALFPADCRRGKTLRAAWSSAVVARYRAEEFLVSDGRCECYCPCCEMKLRAWDVARFAEQPEKFDARRYAEKPQNVVCPVCGSIPRHRIIVWHLGEHPELAWGKKILHFAPERGVLRWLRHWGFDVTTADLRGVADLRLDLCDIDLPDGSYDVVICNHVLEHVADWRVALSEVRRVLRPGGLLICSFPIDSRYETVYEDANVVTMAGRVAHFGQYDHLRVFGADSASLLVDAGFEVEVVCGGDCPDVIRPVVGPADYDSDQIFFCWKQG